MESPRIVLASESPRRRELLGRLLTQFEVRPSGVDESCDPDANPEKLAADLATAKARTVAAATGHGLVLGADTLIDLEGRVIGKPTTVEEAVGMLRELRGRTHRVITGLCLINARTGREDCRIIFTSVRMKASHDRDLLAYVRSREPLDKAGAYAIQEEGGKLVESIEGCYNNVVGLPLCETASLLLAFGVEGLPQPACVDPEGRPCPHLGKLSPMTQPDAGERTRG